MIYLAVFATILFLASVLWMVRDAYHAVMARGRPGALSIVVFAVMGETVAILWWLVWNGAK